MIQPYTSTRQRSLLKALSWETFSTVIVFFLAWLMFGSVSLCVMFAVVSFIVKLVLFYIHDRVWHQIPYGKQLNE